MEVTMRTVLGILLIACLMIPFVAMADEPIVAPEDTPIAIEEPIVMTNDVVVMEPIAVDTEYVPYTKSFLKVIMEFIGLEPRETTVEAQEDVIDVVIENEKVATIPVNSKFAGMEIHEQCLPFQYGTDNWYECERALL